MPKIKRLYAICKICNKQLTIDVSADLAKDREYYPFEYIDIHGDPEHALMLFLDKYLVVRDAVAYSDLRIVKNKGNEYKTLIKMSETDSFAAIYSDPLRLQVLFLLREGSITEDNLIEYLKKFETFNESDLNMLMLPLIRTNLIKTGWLQETFQMCYFLIKDFSVFRIPASYTSKLFKKDERYKPFSSLYLQRSNEILDKYKTDFLDNEEARIRLIKECLEIRTSLKYFNVYNTLLTGPLAAEELMEQVEESAIDEMVEKEFIIPIKTKNTTYYALLTEIFIQTFSPQYLLNNIAQKLERQEITREMALTHLDFLFNAAWK